VPVNLVHRSTFTYLRQTIQIAGKFCTDFADVQIYTLKHA